ncbi:MAG: hypothetical protein GY828_08710, partial [Candidatus Gracilibacteria bacterium]|nr:hypothetical protein [Candidatus Gracilibacteria bacterium]
MVETTKTIQYLHKGRKGAVIFFIIVLLLTLGFKGYNMSLEKKAEAINNTIMGHKKVIEELESNKKIVIYALIQENKKLLSEMDKRSHVTKYIDHLDYIRNQYKVDMRGFDLKNGDLSVKLHFTTDDEGIAY